MFFDVFFFGPEFMTFLFVTCRKTRFYVFSLQFYSTWICVYFAYFHWSMQRKPSLCVIPAVLQYLYLCYQKCDKISTSAYSKGRFFFVFFALGAFYACFIAVVFKCFFVVFKLSLENAVESVNFKSKYKFCFPCVFCSNNMASYAVFFVPWACYSIFHVFIFFVFWGVEPKEFYMNARPSWRFQLMFTFIFTRFRKRFPQVPDPQP